MPAGRPTTYKPEYCEAVLKYGEQGKSVTWMAATLGVDKDTIYEWGKKNPEFSVALTRARHLSQMWWEDAGQINMLLPPGAGTFNASVWSRSMAARFPEEWRESNKTEITGKDGAPLTEMGELEIARRVAFSLELGMQAAAKLKKQATPQE